MPAGPWSAAGARRAALACRPSAEVVGSVRTRRSFAALSASRTRGRSGPLWVVRADPVPDDPLPPDETVAVAYAIGTAVGPAVVRNRLRRRLRVLMTELDHANALPGGQYLVGATPAAAPLGFDQLRDHLASAVHAVDPARRPARNPAR